MAMVPFNKRSQEIMRSPFYGFMDDFFHDNWTKSYTGFKMDVSEDDKSYTVEADMPGVNKGDIDLSLHDGTLSIAVNHEESKEEKKQSYTHRERSMTSMSRSVYLADAKDSGISAKLNDGVLSIIVPKREGAGEPSKITIE